MPLEWSVAAMILAAAGSLIFSTLTYSLRDMSRARLADYLARKRRSHLLEPTIEHLNELIFVTAVARMLANTLVVLASVWICQATLREFAIRDVAIFFLAAVITLFFSVAFPQAITRYAGDSFLATSIGALHLLRILFKPLAGVMHLTDRFVRDAAGAAGTREPEQIEEQIEQDILSAVEEGEQQGVVDEQEREMIESVIEFHDSTAGRIMTARPDIAAIDIKSDLQHVRQVTEDSGHSRLPVYEGSLDKVVGILYARDLLRYVGQSADTFDMRSAMRPPVFVPESTPLGELLREFRKRKSHIAIVLDEYGGTTGLLTLEDILKALVGEISEEHEATEPALFKRISENTFEADAKLDLDEFNRLTGLNLPEDAGYATLGGFVLATLGRIPDPGVSFEHQGVKYTVLEAEPQRVKRLRIDLAPQPAIASASSAPTA